MGRPRGGKNRYHSKEFKLGIINRILAGEGSYSIAKEYELSPSMIRKWVRSFQAKGPLGLENKKKTGNPLVGMYRKRNMSEVEQLRFELAKAEVELAKLKKVYGMERSVAIVKNSSNITSPV